MADEGDEMTKADPAAGREAKGTKDEREEEDQSVKERTR